MKKILLPALLILTTNLFATNYSVDPDRSHVTFKVRHLLFSTVKGSFRDFSGSYTIDDGRLEALEGRVKAASVTTGSEKRDRYLLSDKFFNPRHYPDMTMRLLYMQKGDAVVSLKIKNISDQVRLKTTLTDDGVTLRGKISRKAFGLTWGGAIEAGGVVVGDDVRIRIDLHGTPR